MKSSNEDAEKTLQRLLGRYASPSSERMESAIDRVEDRLRRLPAHQLVVEVAPVPIKRPMWRWAVAAGLAATVCLVLLCSPAPKPVPPPQRPFVSIPHTIPLSPEEPASVARMEIPVEALIAVGFCVEPVNATGFVEADVLISQDGRIRAIRPISGTLSN